MNKYYFTFGQDHYNIECVAMRDYYVLVTANDYGEAREIFIKNFTSIEMSQSDKWSHQYEENTFNSEYFPKGEYASL